MKRDTKDTRDAENEAKSVSKIRRAVRYPARTAVVAKREQEGK